MANSLADACRQQIKTFSEEIWEHRATRLRLDPWLANFAQDDNTVPSERLHALFLLSQFMYFGTREIRALLVALYRDTYRYPIIAAIRRTHGNTRDRAFLDARYEEERRRTRFLGVGNPSESGQHLLYYFRQENRLPKELFINAHEIFVRDDTNKRVVRHPEVCRYVFLDDFCGSGTQAKTYSRELIEELKSRQPEATAHYYSLFGTEEGIRTVETSTQFDSVRTVFTLDDSYKVFSPTSRYFALPHGDIDRGFAEDVCRRYGTLLFPKHPLGYKDCQLLIGFMHNVPDNTLPVIWSDRTELCPWTPIFRRYPKIEGQLP